jgi:hypothetical protein
LHEAHLSRALPALLGAPDVIVHLPNGHVASFGFCRKVGRTQWRLHQHSWLFFTCAWQRVEDEDLLGISVPGSWEKSKYSVEKRGSAAGASDRGNERVIDDLVRDDCKCSNAFCCRLMNHEFG